MPEERGPSYWDVSAYCQHLRAHWGVACVIELVPPVPVGMDNRWSPWGCRVQVWRGASRVPGVAERVEYFGKNGAWATAPAAAHAALRELEDRLEAAEKQAAAVAAF